MQFHLVTAAHPSWSTPFFALLRSLQQLWTLGPTAQMQLSNLSSYFTLSCENILSHLLSAPVGLQSLEACKLAQGQRTQKSLFPNVGHYVALQVTALTIPTQTRSMPTSLLNSQELHGSKIPGFLLELLFRVLTMGQCR